MSKMNPEIKAKWVAALRSGEYNQAVSVLRNGYGFCCLGVLCDLFASEHGMGDWDVNRLGGNDGDDEEPSDEVREWARLPACNPIVRFEDGEAPVSVFNDGGIIPFTGRTVQRRTFAEIADAIEAQL